MKQIVQRVFTLLIAVSLIACATPQKIGLSPDTKQLSKRVALINIPEPARYTMQPSPAPASAALYMFGAIGGAILGGIEVSRFESATTKFNEAVTPLKPNLSALLVSDLEIGLKQKGYEVTLVPPPPMDKEGKAYDINKIEGTFDAVLVPALSSGYSARVGTASPQVVASITLLSLQNKAQLFADTYIYGAEKMNNNVQIAPDNRFTVATIDDVYTNISLATEGMKEGTSKIAQRVLQEF